jgi:hypothetical protein
MRSALTLRGTLPVVSCTQRSVRRRTSATVSTSSACGQASGSLTAATNPTGQPSGASMPIFDGAHPGHPWPSISASRRSSSSRPVASRSRSR